MLQDEIRLPEEPSGTAFAQSEPVAKRDPVVQGDPVAKRDPAAQSDPVAQGDPSAFKIKNCPAAVRIVIGKLQEAGYEAYAVGGCVRDAMLCREPHDWDVTTSATPEELLRVFEAFRTVPTGIRHGTVTVLIDRLPVEVTTYRIDGVYSDARRPDSVTFTRSLEEDLARRDFTVNAMAYSERDGLVDLFGGREDLAAGRIRAVGDPVLRFTEDALRILRAVRFAVQLGFEVEAGTLAALRQCRAGLARIAPERIREEFLKLLVSPEAGRGMELLLGAGLLDYVLPGYLSAADATAGATVEATAGATAGVPAETASPRLPDGVTVRALDLLPAVPELRLAYLLRPLPRERAQSILRHQRPSGAFSAAVMTLWGASLPGIPRDASETQPSPRVDNLLQAETTPGTQPAPRVDNLLQAEPAPGTQPAPRVDNPLQAETASEAQPAPAGQYPPMPDRAAARRFAARYGELTESALTLIAMTARDGYTLEAADRILGYADDARAEGDCLSLSELAVDGADLIADGFAPGAELGKTLQALLDAVLDNPLLNEKKTLLRLAHQLSDR